MLNCVDDVLHRGDVLSRNEYRIIGKQIGMRLAQSGVRAGLSKMGIQRPLQLLWIDVDAVAASI